MSSHELIDAQFDRAVEIVQSLPKTGPIQTEYDEKLAMYSLFKQATTGNVTTPRPGMWDMLGRAKWDAWAKHKDLNPYEAKWRYVEALLKVLRKYSEKTIATNLVEELESYYEGDPSQIVMRRTMSKSPGSDTSGSTVSEHTGPIPNLGNKIRTVHPVAHDDSTDESDEDQELPAIYSNRLSEKRPESSTSSHRYRTPVAGSMVMSPTPSQQYMPSQQPLPGFETPSVFADHINPAPPFHPASPRLYPGQSSYCGQMQSHPSAFGEARPPSRMALERAVENVQVHLAALSERLETLESRSFVHAKSNASGSPNGSATWVGGRRSPGDKRGDLVWDIDDLGMWSLIIHPVARVMDRLREIPVFLSSNSNRSPSMIIIRRLCLDISFLLCVIALIRALWKMSGVRRREVKAALVVLWKAIVGSKSTNNMFVNTS